MKMFGKSELKEKTKKRGNSFTLSDAHMQKVYELAEIFGVSSSEIIRRAIDEYYISMMERLSKIKEY